MQPRTVSLGVQGAPHASKVSVAAPRPCKRSEGLQSGRSRGRCVAPQALAGTGSDVVSSVSQLIAQSATEGTLSHHASFMHALHSVLDSHSLYAASSSLAGQHDVSSMPDALSAASSIATALPVHDLAVDPQAVQGLSDIAVAASQGWLDLAATNAAALAGPHAASLQALAVLATEQLSAVKDIDPASYTSMQSSLDSVLAAFNDLLQQEMGLHAVRWTNALVLGVQQLVAATRMEEAGGAYSVLAMAEAQAAMEQAAKSVEVDGLMTVTMAVLALIVACLPRFAPGSNGQGQVHLDDEVPLRYDPEALSQFWSKRPVPVMQRSAEVVSKFSGFLVEIFMDARTGRWESNMAHRAAQLRKMVETMGATCVKIAQAASTRVDMLPKVYLDEFCRLQDNVRTFSTVEARFVLEEGLGRPVDTVFEWLSEEPLAAASLGQVYRGKLRPEYGGNEVAVKVQRPGVLESAALDVFIMRRAAVLFSKLPGMSDGWANVLDDWALRFFQEMDYNLEASNTITFKKQMASLQGIMVPTVHPEFTSRRVIVSDWIEGEKLADSKASDVRALCSTLLNCYLIQLLETGLLHADPHPGNLMRTTDGKLVILDFGLMTEVTESQRIGLVEFIAHLTMEDWDGLTNDLVTLGFMPETMSDEARQHIKPVIHQVFSKIVSGGGLGKAGLNFTSLGLQLSHISMSYQLCIPGYFTNVLRAFSVIEGTALKVDPNYAIVQECSPYLSRRLLTDNNQRMRAALRQLLYGNGQRLDVARLQRLISSFSSFTTSAHPSSSASGPTFSSAYSEERVKGSRRAASSGRDEGPVLNETMREALKVVFAKDGSYAQELIVEELVAATDAMSREALSEALRLVMGSATAVAALRSVEALGPLRAMILPIPLPIEMLHSMEPAVALTKEDRQALDTLRAVLELMQPSLVQGIPNVAQAGTRAVRVAGEVMPMLPELLPGVQVTVELFLRQLVRRMALRLAEDLEPGKFAGSGMPAPGTSAMNSAPSNATYPSGTTYSSGFNSQPPSGSRPAGVSAWGGPSGRPRA